MLPMSYCIVCRSGRATYQNGGTYEGDFQSDHRWGWGKHTFPDGTIYEGEWFDDIIEGNMTMWS